MEKDFDPYHIPETISQIMAAGGSLAISISGGKDSQAMLNYVVHLYKHFGWQGTLFAIFADLGEIEWQGTLEHCYAICREAGVPLVVVQRSQGGLIERWWQRWESIKKAVKDGKVTKKKKVTKGRAAKGKVATTEKVAKLVPPFSSSTNRFCTDHLKVQPVDKYLRKIQPLEELPKIGSAPPFSDSKNRFCTSELKTAQCDKELRARASQLVVCCVGIRADESKARAKKPTYCVRSNITTEMLKQPEGCESISARESWADQAWRLWSDGSVPRNSEDIMPRLGITWHPIHNWAVEQVWKYCGTSGEELEARRLLYDCGLYHQAFAGWKAAWVYVTRNTRLSCALCVLGSAGDVSRGCQLNPGTWRKIVEIEQATGYSFRQDMSLTSLSDHVKSFPAEKLEAIYGALRELGLIYLDQHWRLNGAELTELLSRGLKPQELAKAFVRRLRDKVG